MILNNDNLIHVHGTLNFLCAILILTPKIHFFFRLDEQSLLTFACIDSVCKEIKQCKQSLTSYTFIERWVYVKLFVYFDKNTYCSGLVFLILRETRIFYIYNVHVQPLRTTETNHQSLDLQIYYQRRRLIRLFLNGKDFKNFKN